LLLPELVGAAVLPFVEVTELVVVVAVAGGDECVLISRITPAPLTSTSDAALLLVPDLCGALSFSAGTAEARDGDRSGDTLREEVEAVVEIGAAVGVAIIAVAGDVVVVATAGLGKVVGEVVALAGVEEG
jgi:hypothetical protein